VIGLSLRIGLFNIGLEGDLSLSRVLLLFIRAVGRLCPILERSHTSFVVSVAWTRPRVGLRGVLIDHGKVRIIVKCSSLVQVLLAADFRLARSFHARLASIHNTVKLSHISIVACLAG
jgi:hypothetical protein